MDKNQFVNEIKWIKMCLVARQIDFSVMDVTEALITII